MDEASVPGCGEGLREVESRFGPPAYVRRARQVQEAYDALLAHCRVQREGCLQMVRVRLGLLHALAGRWEALRPFLADDEQVETLRSMYAELAPRLRVVVGPTTSAHAHRQALRELLESVARFNRLWREFLAGVDVGRVNELRGAYNRYYLLEKECALRSPRLARQGYVPLPPLTIDELEALLPPLPSPRLNEPR